MDILLRKIAHISILLCISLVNISYSKEISHHPIILQYAQFQGGEASFDVTFANPRLSVDIVGYFNFFGFLASETSFPKRVASYTWDTKISKPSLPNFNEEYFEWIDVLEAVDQATDQFVMLEIGANYGRWSGRAAAAAKIRKIPVYLGIVEAIPFRFKLIEENMAYNDVGPENYKIYSCAVGNIDTEVFFYIESPTRNKFLTNWRGQSILPDQKQTPRPINQMLDGYQVYQTQNNYLVVKVEQMRLSSIVEDVPYEVIDLCDFDIQGAEFDAINEAIAILNQKVKRLHIGTHSRDIEKKLKSLLLSNQWRKVRDFPNHSLNETEYGKIQFVDGVQTWENKRFF